MSICNRRHFSTVVFNTALRLITQLICSVPLFVTVWEGLHMNLHTWEPWEFYALVWIGYLLTLDWQGFCPCVASACGEEWVFCEKLIFTRKVLRLLLLPSTYVYDFVLKFHRRRHYLSIFNNSAIGIPPCRGSTSYVIVEYKNTTLQLSVHIHNSTLFT